MNTHTTQCIHCINLVCSHNKLKYTRTYTYIHTHMLHVLAGFSGSQMTLRKSISLCSTLGPCILSTRYSLSSNRAVTHNSLLTVSVRLWHLLGHWVKMCSSWWSVDNMPQVLWVQVRRSISSMWDFTWE